MSYNFWNQFVNDWLTLPANELANPIPAPPFNHFMGWLNPNSVHLMNSNVPGDFSLQYIPEPWWGNSGNEPLHCVFLNHNPFSGGLIQTQAAVAALMLQHPQIQCYQELVHSQVIQFDNEPADPPVFNGTCKWHFNHRASQIVAGLNIIENLGINEPQVSSLLSIELIPWHTNNFGNIEFNYFLNNLNVTFLNTFLFAANESRRIDNETLINKPLIRTTRTRIIPVLDLLQENELITGYFISPVHNVPEFNYSWDWFRLSHSDFEDITFVRIQAYGNDLPGYPGTQDFLQRINGII